ncbi:MAG: circadian clock KaiB family protein [Trueperaceae bacterium]|nr:circadian clock KaiB family protein [Trueperaceae bacterium]
MPSFHFELYVAGDAPRSRTAVRSLTELCEERLSGRYELDVIDVLAHPERAEQAKILATPTLLRLRPAPRVRIVGDLSLTANVVAGLGLDGEDEGDERDDA